LSSQISASFDQMATDVASFLICRNVVLFTIL
jgi:hypothetical protein